MIKKGNKVIPRVIIGISIASVMFFLGSYFSYVTFEEEGRIVIERTMISMVAMIAMGIMVLIMFLLFGIYVIVSYKRKKEKKLINDNQMYENLIANIQGGVITCIFDAKTSTSKTVYINDGWTELTGYTLDELNKEMGGDPQALVFADDKKITNKHYIEQTLKGNSYKLQYRIVRKDNSIVWAIDRGVVTVHENGNVQNQSIITEVTEIKEKEEQLRKLAQTDQLTGLNNKVAAASLAQIILDKPGVKLHALMVLDIDNFKGINDSLGHIFGDTVLIEVSARLRLLFRNQDIIGRAGGDEFVILMSDILSKEVAEKKANEVCDTFRNTYIGESGDYRISCSLGISFSTDGDNYQELFNKADNALYKAKVKGKDQYVVYENDDNNNDECLESVGCITEENELCEKYSGELEIKERFFELLYGSLDFDGSINIALSVLGRIMDISKVYIFENSKDNQISTNTYEWCAEGVPSTFNKFHEVKIAQLNYLDLFDENGVFYWNNFEVLRPEIRELWSSQNIKSLMQIAISENGVICGFIGFDSLLRIEKPTRENLNIMTFAAKVIGMFILKKRAGQCTQLYSYSKFAEYYICD